MEESKTYRMTLETVGEMQQIFLKCLVELKSVQEALEDLRFEVVDAVGIVEPFIRLLNAPKTIEFKTILEDEEVPDVE